MTCIDQKPYLTFIPNIPIEVWNNNNPEKSLHLPFIKFLDRDNIDFIQAEVKGIDVDAKKVEFKPVERSGSAAEEIQYDYLVIALGNKLAFDEIEGFGQYGHTFTDTYYGDKVRRYLHDGGYKGGPIAVGSDLFVQGKSPDLPEVPVAEAPARDLPLRFPFRWPSGSKNEIWEERKRLRCLLLPK